MRSFSLYGVDTDDHVASCEHFAAATTADAVQRAYEKLRRFHKVELWERSTCVLELVRPEDDGPKRSSLATPRSWFRLGGP
jgi:hypothetical protein